MRIYVAGAAYCSRCGEAKAVSEDVVYCLDCGCHLRRVTHCARERKKLRAVQGI